MLKNNISLSGILIVTILALIVCLSCGNQKTTVSLDQEFTLLIGETAIISGEDLSLEFIEVTADSRCPEGVQCVWAGEAKCRISVTYQGSTSEVILTQPGGSKGSQDLLGRYNVRFILEPYPESGKQIAKSDYKLVMTVTR